MDACPPPPRRMCRRGDGTAAGRLRSVRQLGRTDLAAEAVLPGRRQSPGQQHAGPARSGAERIARRAVAATQEIRRLERRRGPARLAHRNRDPARQHRARRGTHHRTNRARQPAAAPAGASSANHPRDQHGRRRRAARPRPLAELRRGQSGFRVHHDPHRQPGHRVHAQGPDHHGPQRASRVGTATTPGGWRSCRTGRC